MNLAAALLLAAEDPNGTMLPGDINELWWAIVAFLVIAALLYKLAYPPILKGLHSRTSKIESELGVAEAARAEALAEADAVRSSVADADAEADRIVAEAHEAAAQLGVTLRERADAEAVDLRHRAAADIESQKAQAIADLQAEVAALAQGAAEAVVRHNLDDATQAALIDSYIDQVGA